MNIIVTDSQQDYGFIDNINSGFIHHQYNHGRGDFGYSLDSTSRIEGLWAEIRAIIKRLYNTVCSDNFIYFLREAEYRRLIKNLTNDQKLEYFAMIYSIVVPNSGFNFLNEEELKSIDFDTLFEE